MLLDFVVAAESGASWNAKNNVVIFYKYTSYWKYIAKTKLRKTKRANIPPRFRRLSYICNATRLAAVLNSLNKISTSSTLSKYPKTKLSRTGISFKILLIIIQVRFLAISTAILSSDALISKFEVSSAQMRFNFYCACVGCYESVCS